MANCLEILGQHRPNAHKTQQVSHGFLFVAREGERKQNTKETSGFRHQNVILIPGFQWSSDFTSWVLEIKTHVAWFSHSRAAANAHSSPLTLVGKQAGDQSTQRTQSTPRTAGVLVWQSVTRFCSTTTAFWNLQAQNAPGNLSYHPVRTKPISLPAQGVCTTSAAARWGQITQEERG